MIIEVRGIEYDDLTEGQRREVVEDVFDTLHENHEKHPEEVIALPETAEVG